jgi:hypothetical protein
VEKEILGGPPAADMCVWIYEFGVYSFPAGRTMDRPEMLCEIIWEAVDSFKFDLVVVLDRVGTPTLSHCSHRAETK